MENRIFICTHSQLPGGDANSNYIFHMALSLKQANYEVITIGRSKDTNRQVTDIEGIYCINLERKEHIPAKVEGHLFYGNRLIDELKSLDICENDYVIIYGGFVSLFTAISSRLKFMKKGHIITCVVEWPTPNQFRWKYLDLNYLFWKYVFYRMIPRWKKVIVISDNLCCHFNELGCNTFILPPLIDSQDKVIGEKKVLDKIQFIYAGADTKKDAIKSMLLAINELSEEEKGKFRLNITSLTEKKARKLLKRNQRLIDENHNCLRIHGWMNYSDLIKIYYSTDYLLLPRETNQFTLSNFPSKIPEMMNYGIIPVCSRVGDYTGKYLIDMVDSIIFEGSSPRECSNAIRNALSISEDRRKYMSEHAIANAKQNFDYRAWSQKLTEFILG